LGTAQLGESPSPGSGATGRKVVAPASCCRSYPSTRNGQHIRYFVMATVHQSLVSGHMTLQQGCNKRPHHCGDAKLLVAATRKSSEGGRPAFSRQSEAIVNNCLSIMSQCLSNARHSIHVTETLGTRHYSMDGPGRHTVHDGFTYCVRQSLTSIYPRISRNQIPSFQPPLT
jgi:hypothetical protein